MEAVENFVAFQQQNVAALPRQLNDQDEVPEKVSIHLLLQAEAYHALVGILGNVGHPCADGMFAEIGAEPWRDKRVGVLFLGQMEAVEIRMGGDEQLLIFPGPPKAEKEIGAVHLVDLGDESAGDFLFQFLHDPVNKKGIHGSPDGLRE
jgi:hypothetical protein